MAAMGIGTTAVSALVALSGCTGQAAGAQDRPSAAARQSVAGAAAALVRSGTSRFRTTMVTAGDGSPRTITGDGTFDYVAGRGALTVVLPPGAPEPGPVTEVVAPGALYLRHRGAGVPRDKWLRVDTARLADGDLVTGGATDPLAAARLLGGVREAAPAGTERVAGAVLWRYRGITRPPAAIRSFAGAPVPFDVALDARGRPRRLREVFTYRTPDGHRMTVTSVTEVYDFGVPVRIALPRAADTYPGMIVSPQG